MAGNVTIGMAAKRTGLSPRAIRYYEDKGLLPPRPRTVGGYRQYGEADVKRLLFIRRAKDLGISLRQISALLDCWPESTCAMSRPLLKKTLAERVGELPPQLALLGELRGQLKRELSELEIRPYSDHSRGYCECLGEAARVIPVQDTGNGKNQH